MCCVTHNQEKRHRASQRAEAAGNEDAQTMKCNPTIPKIILDDCVATELAKGWLSTETRKTERSALLSCSTVSLQTGQPIVDRRRGMWKTGAERTKLSERKQEAIRQKKKPQADPFLSFPPPFFLSFFSL